MPTSSQPPSELALFFDNPIFGAFFMQLDAPVRWNTFGDNEQNIAYILHHMRITKVNDTMLRQYHAGREDFIGRTPYQFFEHDLPQEIALLTNIFNHGQYHEISTERTTDGKEVIFEGDYRALYNSAGELTGVMGIQQDITERHKHLQAIEEQNKKLITIAWQQSHEVRAPLARLMSLVDLLHLETQLDSDLLRYIRESAEELDRIVHDIAAQSEQVRSHLTH